MRWEFRSSPPDPDTVRILCNELKLLPALARLLVARGYDTPEAAQRFLYPAISHLHPPGLMLGMTAATERLCAAIATRERVLIYGDYDVDGTTAIVLLKTAIERCGGIAEFYVPHRIREGYGMRDEVIEQAAAEGVKLVISVDTGIRAFAAAEAAHRVGLDLIVTDHHLPEAGEGVPRALAVLNPNQPGCEYPCKHLCGAAVAFKLAQSVMERCLGAAESARLLPSFLKMLAIATIADAVPLTGENRVIAKLGLEGLRRPVNGGLKVLMQVADCDPQKRALTATDVAFRLAPRLNAAGRMDVARDVVELFTSTDESRVAQLGAKLNQLNTDRQQEEARMLADIASRLENDVSLREPYCLVLAGDGWHRGVVGIAATRVVERTGKPALVVSREGEEAHGSGRSISRFHLLDALESCRELFTRFGGHAHAVGFALPSENLPALAARLDAFARERLTPDDLIPVLTVDDELPLEQVSFELLDQLRSLEPFGMGNREPIFVARHVLLALPPKVLKEKHLKLRVRGTTGAALDAIGWRMAERLASQPLAPGDAIDLSYTLDENQHPDFGGLQLKICDLVKSAAAQAAAGITTARPSSSPASSFS